MQRNKVWIANAYLELEKALLRALQEICLLTLSFETIKGLSTSKTDSFLHIIKAFNWQFRVISCVPKVFYSFIDSNPALGLNTLINA